MSGIKRENKIYYTLRIAVAMCFIGHGAFGIITKPIWCNYFAVFGIGHDLAYRLMPLVGSIDILMGIIALLYPLRIIPLWLVLWGIVTASLRPLSGEPFAEFIERAGNFGAPFALLLMTGGLQKDWKSLFRPLKAPVKLDAKTNARLITCLQIVVFLLLAGHGWLNLIEKKGIISQYNSIGFTDPALIAKGVGYFEIFSAFLVLSRPFRPALIILLVWKICTELFYPHYELLEWVERGGSYGALLALWFALDTRASVITENNLHKPKYQLR